MKKKSGLALLRAAILGTVTCAVAPVHAQNAAAQNSAQPVVDAAGQTVNNAGQITGNVTAQLPGTISAVGNTANGLVGGLQPTLQPVGQGVGGALNNLTQPDNVSALLEFLSSIVPNHIEAHVNLDALRVEKLTVDVRGVDLRNLKVDLLVANSRNAGAVKAALPNNAPGTNLNAGVATAPRPLPNAANPLIFNAPTTGSAASIAPLPPASAPAPQ